MPLIFLGLVYPYDIKHYHITHTCFLGILHTVHYIIELPYTHPNIYPEASLFIISYMQQWVRVYRTPYAYYLALNQYNFLS